ncbi:hypothetical protein FIBSPDRAFT_966974 [Athelia psychrophila]|uniref:Uncharacterized protein n=1 Tax=Athelia psychrophila TaxID=1759441 RepID=A0A167W7U3_9AGAM|nr:hypothetical protein FIBSPDRAFT_966974 [Fibularhizoctonia sp. CBS 109695]
MTAPHPEPLAELQQPMRRGRVVLKAHIRLRVCLNDARLVLSQAGPDLHSRIHLDGHLRRRIVKHVRHLAIFIAAFKLRRYGQPCQRRRRERKPEAVLPPASSALLLLPLQLPCQFYRPSEAANSSSNSGGACAGAAGQCLEVESPSLGSRWP